MIPAIVRSPDAAAKASRERRRRFGLDAPLPADPFVIERAVLRHIAACRPDAVVLKLAREPAPAPQRPGIDLAAGVPDLLLLLPNGRAAFLAIRTQAQTASRPERAFADLCRMRAVPVHVVRSLPEARQALDRRGRPGHDDATPERLVQARRTGTADLDGQGVRRIGDAFDTLQARGLLDRQSPDENARLWQAGDRLRRHWHMSRLDGLTAFDFTRDAVDTSPGQSAGPSEGALRHRDAIRAAMAAVGPRLWAYAQGVVIDARPISDMRVLVTDTGHARTADALALERLRESLHRLCDLWKMRADDRPRRIGTWRDRTPEPVLTEP